MKKIKTESGTLINIDCIHDGIKNRIRLNNGSERTLFMDEHGHYVYPNWHLLGKAPKFYLRNVKQAELDTLTLLTD